MENDIFNRDKKRLSLSVTRGFGYLVRYHLGTVAFGALIIGIVRLVRAILSFIQNHLKHYDNSCVKGILWCCQCCLWCFECALKFLTRNAYIEVGKWNLFYLILYFIYLENNIISFSYIRMQLLHGWEKSVSSFV